MVCPWNLETKCFSIKLALIYTYLLTIAIIWLKYVAVLTDRIAILRNDFVCGSAPTAIHSSVLGEKHCFSNCTFIESRLEIAFSCYVHIKYAQTYVPARLISEGIFTKKCLLRETLQLHFLEKTNGQNHIFNIILLGANILVVIFLPNKHDRRSRANTYTYHHIVHTIVCMCSFLPIAITMHFLSIWLCSSQRLCWHCV